MSISDRAVIEWLENHGRKIYLTVIEMDATGQQWPNGLKDHLRELCQDVDFFVEDLKKVQNEPK